MVMHRSVTSSSYPSPPNRPFSDGSIRRRILLPVCGTDSPALNRYPIAGSSKSTSFDASATARPSATTRVVRLTTKTPSACRQETGSGMILTGSRAASAALTSTEHANTTETATTNIILQILPYINTSHYPKPARQQAPCCSRSQKIPGSPMHFLYLSSVPLSPKIVASERDCGTILVQALPSSKAQEQSSSSKTDCRLQDMSAEPRVY